MSADEALAVVAHESGVDVSRYLGPAESQAVRLILSNAADGRAGNGSGVSPKGARRAYGRRVPEPSTPDLDDVPVSAGVLADARRMANLYPKMYVLENLVRQAIVQRMHRAHGKDWWATHAPSETRIKVSQRQGEEARKPWHGRRDAGEVYYCDFPDLRRIIEKNWAVFEPLFRDRNWLTMRLTDLEGPRNVLAHSNPVSKDDETRILLYLRDISSVLRQATDQEPSIS